MLAERAKSRNFWKDIASIASDGKYYGSLMVKLGICIVLGLGMMAPTLNANNIPTPERVGQAWDDDIMAACKSRALWLQLACVLGNCGVWIL